MRSVSRLYICIYIAILTLGCSAISWQAVQVDELDVDPPQLLVANKVQTPLLIVLDPDQVPENYTVTATNGQPLEIYNLQAFVTHHLQRTLTDYFHTVEVISPDDPRPSTPHILAIVRVTDIGMIARGDTVFGQMTWSFGLMPSGHDDFLFSYAGSAQGNSGTRHVQHTQAMYASTFTAAIGSMLQYYSEREVQQILRQAERESEPDSSGGGINL